MDISLRDYFAAHATEQDITRYLDTGRIEEYVTIDTHQTRRVATRMVKRTREEARYAFADAMMKARNQ